MHEISLCESVLRVIEDQSAALDYHKVEAVRLEIGMLAGVEIDALRFGFDVVMKGSIAEDARLEIIAVPGRAWCPHCARNVAIRQRFDACPDCGGHQLQVNGGEELRIKELEVA
jgi:hydrogenase nickel incorporation protein HypA/HybF